MRNKGLESIVVEFGVAAFALLLPQEGKHTSKQHTHEDSINNYLKLVSNVRNKQKHLKLLSGTVTTILLGHSNSSTAGKTVGYMTFLHKKRGKTAD